MNFLTRLLVRFFSSFLHLFEREKKRKCHPECCIKLVFRSCKEPAKFDSVFMNSIIVLQKFVMQRKKIIFY